MAKSLEVKQREAALRAVAYAKLPFQEKVDRAFGRRGESKRERRKLQSLADAAVAQMEAATARLAREAAKVAARKAKAKRNG